MSKRPGYLEVEMSKESGFTAIELMVALLIVAILAAMAGPAFLSFVRSVNIISQTRSLTSDLQAARSEAITRNGSITLCPSAGGTVCGSDWTQQRIMFVDTNGDKTLSAGEQLIRTTEKIGTDQVLSTLPAVMTGIVFRASGGVISGTTMTLCNSNLPGVKKGRQLVIATTGRVTVTLANCP